MDLFNDLNWYALYTKSRHEKLVESELLKKGIPAYTPKRTIKNKWSDRIKSVEEPLFKSYCFAKFCLKDKITVLSQAGVVSIVNFNQQCIPISESVINSLKILIENNISLDPYPYLKVGDRIVIKAGPLKDVEGFIIEKRKNNSTLVVSVHAISSSVKCFVDIDYVETV